MVKRAQKRRQNITIEQLYEEMKKSLRMFDLNFHDMAEVQVRFAGDLGQLIFTHGDRHIALQLGHPVSS